MGRTAAGLRGFVAEQPHPYSLPNPQALMTGKIHKTRLNSAHQHTIMASRMNAGSGSHVHTTDEGSTYSFIIASLPITIENSQVHCRRRESVSLPLTFATQQIMTASVKGADSPDSSGRYAVTL